MLRERRRMVSSRRVVGVCDKRAVVRAGAVASALASFFAAGCSQGSRESPRPQPQRAESRVAVLSALSGDVRVKRADADEWVAAASGMALRAEDRMRTLARASATVTFESGSTLEVAESSLVTIAGPAASGVRLEKGAVDVDWPQAPRAGAGRPDGAAPAEFVVETRTARARVSREVVFQ
jgi:hypothetical protein